MLDSAGGVAATTRADPAKTTRARTEIYLVRIGTFLDRGFMKTYLPPVPGGASAPMGFSCPGCEATYFWKVANSGGFNDSCKVRKKCTKSQASSGLITSAKEGIGEPSNPVMKMR